MKSSFSIDRWSMWLFVTMSSILDPDNSVYKNQRCMSNQKSWNCYFVKRLSTCNEQKVYMISFYWQRYVFTLDLCIRFNDTWYNFDKIVLELTQNGYLNHCWNWIIFQRIRCIQFQSYLNVKITFRIVLKLLWFYAITKFAKPLLHLE